MAIQVQILISYNFNIALLKININNLHFMDYLINQLKVSFMLK